MFIRIMRVQRSASDIQQTPQALNGYRSDVDPSSLVIGELLMVSPINMPFMCQYRASTGPVLATIMAFLQGGGRDARFIFYFMFHYSITRDTYSHKQ